MDNLFAGRITALISRLERMRANFYPVDWDADPLHDIIRELRQIVADASEEKPDKPPLRQVGAAGN